MSEPITVSFDLDVSDVSKPLGMRITLDSVPVYENASVSGAVPVSHAFSDDDGEHELCFELFGKQPEHTVIDASGNIVSDVVLTVSNIEIDGINIDQIMYFQAVYQHDYNGTQPMTQDQFYGSMGCNGRVTLKFSTPIYLWLLENM